jgi:hypothetical protein
MSDTHEHDRAGLRGFGTRQKLGLAAAALLVLGGAAGAVVTAETRPSVAMAPATPVAIRSLSSSGIVTVRGRVAEVYGNKFILDDSSGRALVDTGREGEGGLVKAGEPVTVQGRFDRGFVHAAFLVGPDNKVQALGPLVGSPHGPHGGPEAGPGAPPPPPLGADRAPPPPTPLSPANAGPPVPAPAPVNEALGRR